jgi:hypothetical protein
MTRPLSLPRMGLPRMGLPRMGLPRMAVRLAVVPAAVAAVGVALLAPASAATGTPVRPAPGAIVIRTTVSRLAVRTAPLTTAPVVARLGLRGTAITVNCWALGTPVAKNAVWYHTLSPKIGYVASVFTSPRKDPVPGLPKCAVPPFRRTYLTKVPGLVARTGPGTTFRSVGRLGRAGSPVVVTCWVRGQSVKGDNVWYRTVAPLRGYVAGAYLNTGRDPARGVPHC